MDTERDLLSSTPQQNYGSTTSFIDIGKDNKPVENSSKEIIRKEPIIVESLHEHHRHEIQPVIHRQHQKLHVHQSTEHVNEPGDTLATEVHEENRSDASQGKSFFGKVKNILT